jgi:hypothetical protein
MTWIQYIVMNIELSLCSTHIHCWLYIANGGSSDPSFQVDEYLVFGEHKTQLLH